MGKYRLQKRKVPASWVTPKPLRHKPVHRWYVFPHSFTSELVHSLIREWRLGPEDRILDPFAGAGTTVLAAKELGVPATGYDLLPLAVFTTRVKVANYKLPRLEAAWRCLRGKLDPTGWDRASKAYPELVKKALPGKLLGAFEAADNEIDGLGFSRAERDFFRLALLTTIPRYSRATVTGGWLKWVDRYTRAQSLPTALKKRVEMMMQDLHAVSLPRGAFWHAKRADARRLPERSATYSAVISSPPYPNRHDYTRVFGVELMFAFADWDETRQLRYQSFHSHPEAHPERPRANGYTVPRSLGLAVERVRKRGGDPRVVRMLKGYFLDMYLALREIARVCQPGAKIGLVVGNAQYRGVPIMVDELTAEIGEGAGLVCDKLLVARYRGNSSQQMATYGRRPSRESVVLFDSP